MSAEKTPPRLRLVLLTSRGGGHCMHIAERIAAGALTGLRLVAVVTDNPAAGVIAKCTARHIDVRIVPWPGRALREQHDRALAALLDALQADLVGLVGYLRLVGPTLVDAWRGRMFNLHPSLLPAYPGLRAIERAFAAGESELGATVHWVDEGCDTGAVIVQRSIARQPHENLSALTQRVHALEALLLDEALGRLARLVLPRVNEAVGARRPVDA